MGIELRLVAQLRREGEEMVRIGAFVTIGRAHTNYETHIADTCLCSMCSVEQLYFVPYKQKDENVIKQKTLVRITKQKYEHGKHWNLRSKK